MQKSNMFFIGLIKLKLSKKNQEVDEDSADEQNLDTIETSKTDNEWLQEYELIYSSYSIDGY
ncbi:MAG: hypothetical protein MUF28_11630 [Ignavibacterium sp.]|nr:hypothetical protein [Ignavibacterium sp.]